MPTDQARAERIRDLKRAHPDTTWARIAEYVGVKERSAVQWQRTGGINRPNCRKLAELFEVDFEWLWAGPRADTPDLFAVQGEGDSDRLRSIEEKLDRQYVLLGDILAAIGEPDGLQRISRAGRALRALGQQRQRARSARPSGTPKPGARPADG